MPKLKPGHISPTPEEEAEINAGIAADPDNPELTAEDFARMRPASEVLPDLVKRMRGQRGPQKAPTKEVVTLRLDPDVVAHFRAGGKGWQSRINAALRGVVENRRDE